MTIFCTECGFKNVDDVFFCNGCGKKMENDTAETCIVQKRGKVLREANNGDGLIGSEGKQYEFSLVRNWKSDVLPKVGQVVEFGLAQNGEIQAVLVISESQLAKEQADIAMKLAKEKGAAFFKDASERLGVPVLIAWATLVISWFFLNVVTLDVPALTHFGVSFWDLLGFANNSTETLAYLKQGGTGDKGFYALLAVIALVGPAVSQFWKHPMACLGSCMPLVLMLVVSIMIYLSIHDAVVQAEQAAKALRGMFGGALGGQASSMGGVMDSITSMIHIGSGSVGATVSAVYLALIGVKQYFVAQARVSVVG